MSICKVQNGFTLLWLLPLLIALSTFSTSVWFSSSSRTSNKQGESITRSALAQAKQALLGYAVSYPEIRMKDTNNRLAYVYGHLPCPNLDNTNNPGQEAPQCGPQGVSALGRLPWTTLGLPPLKDAAGECLWYAVSGNHKANPKADLLNPDIPGLLSLQTQGDNDLATLEDDIVAVIFSPGIPLAGQTRPINDTLCSSAFSPENFLDTNTSTSNTNISSIAEGITRFTQIFSGSHNAEMNDQMLWITRQELYKAIENRQPYKDGSIFFDSGYLVTPSATKPALAQRVAECLREFGLAGSDSTNHHYGRLPWAAPLNLSSAAPNTFKNDRFNDQKNLLSGRIPMLLWDSKQALIASTLLGTLNNCTSSTDTDCRLFRTNNCTGILPIAGYPTGSDGSSHKDAPDGWLEKWKDHMFYAVAPAYQPKAGFADICQSNNCLSVSGRLYAAIVIFSGPPLVGQKRLQVTDKLNINNYLEGQNANSIANQDRNYGTTGNDQMVCIRPDLTLSVSCND